MRVILMLGTKSHVNAARLKEQRDSLDIEAYGTVKEMMDNVTQRNLTFDRIVVSTASMHDERTMQVLYRFLRDMHPRVTVVYLFQKGKGEELANKFKDIFNSPLYTDMAIETNSISLLEESAVEGVDVIREKYSIRKYGSTESGIIEDSYPEINKDKKVKPSANSMKDDPKRPMWVLPQSKKQPKRTGIFGVKRLTKEQLAIIQLNLKLVSDYMEYALSVQDDAPVHKKYILPHKERRSKSDPVEDYRTERSAKVNSKSNKQAQTKNSPNSIGNPAFTPLELGYYGFSTNFNGRPMMLRLGVRFNQVYNS
jgi:hypothetical protein